LAPEGWGKRSYNRTLTQFYFWRNYQQQEIDLIEFENGTLCAYEMKWAHAKKNKNPLFV
jgi:hypothetical protein